MNIVCPVIIKVIIDNLDFIAKKEAYENTVNIT